MVTVGMKGHYEMTVPEEQLAVRVGSGEVAVFATPMMIAAIEHTAASSVAPVLEAGKTTVGTLVNVGQGRISPADFREILEARDRRKASPTAPPQGLYLYSVEY